MGQEALMGQGLIKSQLEKLLTSTLCCSYLHSEWPHRGVGIPTRFWRAIGCQINYLLIGICDPPDENQMYVATCTNVIMVKM